MIQIFECAQNSPAWYECRAGIATASQFSSILAKGDGKTRATYMKKLAGEIITGKPSEGYSNAHMERGHEMEPEAREYYASRSFEEVKLVGFIRNGQKGASPDALVGNNGLAEIKTKLPHVLIDVVLKDQFPLDHKAQCQGALWVAEREWIDIVCYWPAMPVFTKRAYRDEGYISELSKAVDQFNEELAELVERVRNYGVREAA